MKLTKIQVQLINDNYGHFQEMSKKEKKKYQVRETACYDRECFLPFSGNGRKICRLYEMGSCPERYKEKKGKSKS